MTRQVAKGIIKEDDREQALERISFAPTLEAFGDCDLVIEAATEDEALKHKIFAALCPHLKPTAMLASNTSSISITRLASTTDRPEDFIGMHFMNPVPLMELVELIRGIATEDETFSTAKVFVESLGKTTAVSEDFPAFIVNRILLPMINEAVYTLYEGVGTVEAIDKAMKLGAHHPMGPLELADFIGLDTCLSVMQVLYEGPFGLEIPAVSAAREIRRGRMARPQDEARLLRLSRRKAGSDALTRQLSQMLLKVARDVGTLSKREKPRIDDEPGQRRDAERHADRNRPRHSPKSHVLALTNARIATAVSNRHHTCPMVCMSMPAAVLSAMTPVAKTISETTIDRSAP